MPFSWLPIETICFDGSSLLISTHPFIWSIYHQILDFWSKIRFSIHIIIIQGQMHLLKKIHNFIIPVITFITIIHYNNCLERTAVLWTSLLIPPGLHSTNNLGHCLLPLLHQLHHQPFLLRSLQCNLQKDICPDSDVQVGHCQEATSKQVLLWISPQVWVYRMFISWVKNKCWYLIQRQGLEAQEKICDQTPSQWWILACFFFCLFSLNGLLVVIAVI